MDSWQTDSDLRTYASVPAEPRAAVLLLHGFGDHAGRHAATLDRLAQCGIAAYTYDQRGHGRSPGRPAFVAFAQSVDDSLAIRAKVAAEHPGLPLFLLGASMGGLIAVRSAQRDPAGLAGVVLVAPALLSGPVTSPAARTLGSLLAQIAPGAPLAELDLAGLSRDPAVVASYASDPLVHHGKIPALSVAEMLAAAATALSGAAQWRLPTYIVHGEADRIVPSTGSERFAAAAAPAADITLRLVPGGFHEPFTDPGGSALLDEVADWVLDRATRFAPPLAPETPTAAEPRRIYTWRDGLAFGAAMNIATRLLGTNNGRYEAIERPWFAPPGWVFPVVWGINNVLMIWGNLRVLNAPRSADRTAYLRLWAATWLLYLTFGYAFFRRESPLLGLLVTVNFSALTVLSARRATRIDPGLWVTYSTLLPWIVLATVVAGSVALDNPDPFLDPAGPDAA
jgi:alpha-beta hydrolase superfamily lysophospholipase/tryptophan-rich sensory protein